MDKNIECSLCLEYFKDPRILSCFHTFCRDCLQNYLTQSVALTIPGTKFNCPLCRAENTLPEKGIEGIQKNFYLLGQNEKPSYPMCPDHFNEDLRFFCQDCKRSVCRDCKVVSHSSHTTVMVNDIVAEMRQKVEEILNDCEVSINENEIKLRETIEPDIESLDMAVSFYYQKAELIKKEIDSLLENVTHLIKSCCHEKKLAVYHIEAQSAAKRKKLTVYMKSLSQAVKQNKLDLFVKLFEDLAIKNDEVKSMKEPPSVLDLASSDEVETETKELQCEFLQLTEDILGNIAEFKKAKDIVPSQRDCPLLASLQSPSFRKFCCAEHAPRQRKKDKVSTEINATKTTEVPTNSSNLTNILKPVGPEDTQLIAQTNRGTKEWHQSVNQDVRNQNVNNLFQVFLPKAVPVGLKDKRIDKIISYAKRVEGEKFEMANSLGEYFKLIAEKRDKITKELEMKRIQHQNQQRATVARNNQDNRVPFAQNSNDMLRYPLSNQGEHESGRNSDYGEPSASKIQRKHSAVLGKQNSDIDSNCGEPSTSKIQRKHSAVLEKQNSDTDKDYGGPSTSTIRRKRSAALGMWNSDRDSNNEEPSTSKIRRQLPPELGDIDIDNDCKESTRSKIIRELPAITLDDIPSEIVNFQDPDSCGGNTDGTARRQSQVRNLIT